MSKLIRMSIVAVALTGAVRGLTAWGDNTVDPRVVINNPDWNITVTDFGYSDWLYDQTPGFEGREYLSGEWAAAVGYIKGSGATQKVVNPTWLEPGFSYPDWTTNSNFTASQHITITGQNFGGLDSMAVCRLTNNDLQIDIHYEMVDTVTGMRMGTSAASAATGSSVESNRYVLKQVYTIKNTSGQAISNLNLFQFLHSLQATETLSDNRTYAGALANYRYDVTQTGISTGVSSINATDCTMIDYINFASSVAPVGVDNGWFGIDGPLGSDTHTASKPTVGVHLNIEGLKMDGTGTASTLSGPDHFSPGQGWVAGAQQYGLGSLAVDASVSIDFMLSVKTGTVVTITPPTGGGGGGNSTGGGYANGGSKCAGGVDFEFENITKAGSFFAEYSEADKNEIAERVADHEFIMPNFEIPGVGQLYELEYSGEFDGDVTLTFGYSESALGGLDENSLRVFHYFGGAWHDIGGTVHPLSNTITVTTSSLSPFMIGAVAVPEPGTLGILGLAAVFLLRRRR